MPKALRPVLDTVVLRVMAFAHPEGLQIVLRALRVKTARFPAEVYNWDEEALPLTANDEALSELARGLRYARQQVERLPGQQAQRFKIWLENAQQLPRHHARGSLIMDPLRLEELPRREELYQTFGIGRGESACLVLAERERSTAVFLSSDKEACKVAEHLTIPFLTLSQLIEMWVRQERPTRPEVEELLVGLKAAKFALGERDAALIREALADG
ncbi:MAG: hypothetical protein M3511_07540 [Deinococcota bacterium]|jgi:predicted nucleic acid-binding protein|nr:hypothetical protein [Deinococcota bacterium]